MDNDHGSSSTSIEMEELGGIRKPPELEPLGSGLTEADAPDFSNVLRPIYFAGRAVRKPASPAYRSIRAAQAMSMFLVGCSLIIATSFVLAPLKSKNYGQGVGYMAAAMTPAMLGLLLEGMVVVHTIWRWRVPFSRMARHSGRWLVGTACYLLVWVAIVAMICLGIRPETNAVVGLVGGLLCMVMAAYAVIHVPPHDAPSRPLRLMPRSFWEWLQRTWPERWDPLSASNVEVEDGKYFSLTDSLGSSSDSDSDNEDDKMGVQVEVAEEAPGKEPEAETTKATPAADTEHDAQVVQEEPAPKRKKRKLPFY